MLASLGTDAVGAGIFATFPVAASRHAESGISRRTARRIRAVIDRGVWGLKSTTEKADSSY
jgi:hypothetical protein